MVNLYVVASGGGPHTLVDTLPDLAAAKARVEALEVSFQQWVDAGLPELAETDPLYYYEGCDVYAKDLETGKHYDLDPDTDEWIQTWPV